MGRDAGDASEQHHIGRRGDLRRQPLRRGRDHRILEKLAEVVDTKMREIGDKVPTVDTGKIAILAALNLADELVQCNDQQEGERVEIMEKVAELTGVLTAALDS